MTRNDVKAQFPDATKEQIDALMDIHSADIGDALKKQEKQLADLTTECDDLKARLDTANKTLEGFEGIEPDKLKAEVEKYKKAAADAESGYRQKITERDQRDWIKEQLEKYGVKSPYARAQLTTEIMSAEGGLPWKDSAFLGFDDFMKAAKQKDAGLYQTAEEREAEQKQEELKGKAPVFTGPANSGAPEGKKYAPPKIF